MIEKKLPEGWEWRKLGDIGVYINGKAFKPSEWGDIGKPIVRIQNLTDTSKDFNYYNGDVDSKYLIDNGDILVSWSASLGVFLWNGGEAVLNQHIFKAIPNEEIVTKNFFTYALRTVIEGMKRYTHGSTMKHIVKSDFDNTIMPIPPLDTQRKIVAILEKAEATQRLRAEADALTQDLLQSVFLEMFGDPIRNENGWEVVKLDEICDDITVGIVVRPASYYCEKGIPAFRSLNIKSNGLVTDNLVYINAADNDTKLAKSKIKSDDVLVVRTGYPGTACVVPDAYDGANCIDLIIVRPNHSQVNSQYLSFFINSPYGKAQCLASNTGLAQQHLNIHNIREMSILLPPLFYQKRFAESVEKADELFLKQIKSSEYLGSLTNALLSKAFTGELVT